MHDPHALKLYVDGSAFQNPGKGGYSVFAEYPDAYGIEYKEAKNGSFNETTNNRMELMAVVEALKFARTNVVEKSIKRVIIISDSEYVCSNQNYAADWKRNKWRNREGRPIDNHDLWNEFLASRSKVPAHVSVVWEKGKTRDALKQVDKGAKSAANSLGRKDFGFQPSRIARTKVSSGSATMFNARGQKEIIRVYKYESCGGKELMVGFDLYSQYGARFTVKHIAYLDAEVYSDIHRHSCYLATFNENPKYPKFVALEPIDCPEG